jgi:uncharacterized protein with GYD domain
MPMFVAMLSWTDQGIRTVRDTPKRVKAAKDAAKKLGIEIRHIYLTTGEFDILSILEAPDGERIAKFAIMIGAQGNIRTRTVRAWPEAEMVKLISELP